MLNDTVTSPDTWRPFLNALVSLANSNDCEFSDGGLFSDGSGGSMLLDREVLATLQAEAADCDFLFCAVARPDGFAEVMVVDSRSPHLAGMAGYGAIDGVVLSPGAHPEPYRRQPEPTAGQGFSPGCASELVARIVTDALPGTPAEEPGALAAAEDAFGHPLPPDVRALYATAAGGDLYSIEESSDPDLPWITRGMYVMPLDEVDGRAYCQPQRRYLSWRSGAETAVAPDRFGQLQPLAHSAAWFVVGTDPEAGFFVVDMAPGPNGTVGQLLHLHRDAPVGAQWLAPSLTEYLQNGAVINPRSPFDVKDEAAEFGLIADAVTDVGPLTEVLRLHNLDAPVDLSALAGHPRLRSVFVSSPTVTGCDALTRLPALDYLSLPVAMWRTVIDDGLVPDSLHAAGFEDAAQGLSRAPFADTIEVANDLLRHRGQPPLKVHHIAR
ncbi:SMI1/KNR4 family protein [Mycobacterium sp. ST-F2]|uniref:SMI1/KNR4 family protein n=1 Tax=Mycobacterium sp. ST-F2 TaxID=1490484 RepID=UPI000AE7BEE0|nr:SMI1/KNR4 family protein [Mycobacterium sp. ST-F2]